MSSKEGKKDSFGEKFCDLELTNDEVERLKKCMEDEKFRGLFKEYAEEISNPENRKRYEEEITMLEKERGMDVKFINPNPGHVMKTTLNGKEKCFINICTNEALGKPKSQASVQGSTKGMQWAIPHSVSQARNDIDRAGNKCVVYDVVFHPDTYYMCTKNERFKKMIHDTALDAVERRFDITLDKNNLKFPNIKFKGTPISSVIRTPSDKSKDDGSTTNGPPTTDWMMKSKLQSGLKSNADTQIKTKNSEKIEKELNIKTIVPDYTITHRGYFDMQDFSMVPGCKNLSSRPKELIISVNLPKITAANSVNLEVFEKRLKLKSAEPVKYQLDVALPHPVDESKGCAKFDKSQRKLLVTLEVLEPPPIPQIIPMLKDDRLTEYAKKKAALTTEQKQAEEKAKVKKPKFTEDNRIHYQQGINYRDDDDDEEEENGDEVEEKEFDRSTLPLVHTSKYLVEMIYKHEEGLLRKCPQYIYFQDDEYVSIVIDVSHIFKESIWYVIYDDKLQFVCLSECIEGEMVNSLISLWVFFDDGNLADPSRSRIDISASNVVINLRKSKTGIKWNKMMAGIDPHNLHTRLFATNRNICDLYTMTQKQGQDYQPAPFHVCKANKNEKDFLVLEIEPKNNPKSAKTPKENGQSKDESSKKHQQDNNKSEAKSNKEKSAPKTNDDGKQKKKQQPPQTPTPTTTQANGDNNHRQARVRNLGEQLRELKLNDNDTKHQDAADTDSDDELCEAGEPQITNGTSTTEPPSTRLVIEHKNGVGDKKEIVDNHKSSSAVKLSTSKLAFQLDDN